LTLELKLENISKTLPGFKLRNIDLTIRDGEYFILLGPTGAGKTLFLEIIMGFLKPDQGRIFLDGADVTDIPPEKKNMGYVSQNCTLFPHLNVRQNVEFGLKMRRIPGPQRVKTVDLMLHSMNLKGLESRRPASLSGGEKQKVVLARVLATQPSTILLDEPFTGLDPETTRELKNVFRQLHKDGKTVIHVTHNQVEGFSLGDRMAILEFGAIAQVGLTREVFAKPRTEFVAVFLGYENVFHAQRVEQLDGFCVISVGDVDFKASGEIGSEKLTVAVRPEDVNLQSSHPEKSALNVLEGVILDFIDQGAHVAVVVDTGVRFQAVLTKSSFVEGAFEVGQRVWLSFKADAVKVIG